VPAVLFPCIENCGTLKSGAGAARRLETSCAAAGLFANIGFCVSQFSDESLTPLFVCARVVVLMNNNAARINSLPTANFRQVFIDGFLSF
jgi:hypothetical protein